MNASVEPRLSVRSNNTNITSGSNKYFSVKKQTRIRLSESHTVGMFGLSN